jgi:hypothetical protein
MAKQQRSFISPSDYSRMRPGHFLSDMGSPGPWNLPFLALLALCSFPITAHTQITFEEVSSDRGMVGYLMPLGPVGGAAAADFDNDGDIDVFVPTAQGITDLLFENDGNGNFIDIAPDAGLASTENNRAAIWFDYDGDHRLDLVVGGDCRADPVTTDPCVHPENLRLYHQQQDGRFVDVTHAAGLDAIWGGNADSHRSGLTAGDIDNDGYLDLYVNNWNDRAYLYRNNGDGTFTDITTASGISDQPFDHHQPIMYDFNRDGWMDIYVAVDFRTPNFLWINQGDGTFVDMSKEAGVDNAMTDMGIALGDYDNDLDMDMYVTNVATGGQHNVFYRNDSDGPALQFSEISQELDVWQGYWGWGTTFLDADNDGWLDLAATNGKNVGQWRTEPSRFFLNRGGNPVTFEDVSDAVKFNDTFIASSLIAFDYDRDGDLDMVQTAQEIGSLQLLENVRGPQAAGNNYLVIRPRMGGKNHFAIGAEVIITVGSRQMIRVIKTATSTLGQEPAEAFFGLGAEQKADRVLIRWPNGTESELTDVQAGQVLTVESEAGFQINPGLNDAWYNPAIQGQGFFVTVFPQIAQIFLAWFTYDTERPDDSTTAQLGEPGHRWLTAFGPYADGQAVLDIEVTVGGVFDSGSPVPSQDLDGEIIVEFTGCNQGKITYDIPSVDRQGVIPIERIALDNVSLCEALISQ